MYKGGVVTSATCQNSGIKLDHAIQLVGFNEDAKVPYWIGESGHTLWRLSFGRGQTPEGERGKGAGEEKRETGTTCQLSPSPTYPRSPLTQFATPGTPTGATRATSTSRWERTRAASPTCLPWSPLSPPPPTSELTQTHDSKKSRVWIILPVLLNSSHLCPSRAGAVLWTCIAPERRGYLYMPASSTARLSQTAPQTPRPNPMPLHGRRAHFMCTFSLCMRVHVRCSICGRFASLVSPLSPSTRTRMRDFHKGGRQGAQCWAARGATFCCKAARESSHVQVRECPRMWNDDNDDLG